MTRQKLNTIKCCACGKFIRFDDIDSGTALHKMLTPDSHVSREEWDSLCPACYAKEKSERMAHNEGAVK